MHRRAMTTAAAMLAAGTVLAGCSEDSQSVATKSQTAALVNEQTTTDQGMHLWNVGAAGGSFNVPASANYGDAMKLTLVGVNANALEFSDRPARRGWQLPTADLVNSWSELFGEDPPNAVLSYTTTPTETPSSVVLELTKPEYDVESASLTLSATLIPIVAAPHPAATTPVPATPMLPPMSFENAALFIDATAATPEQPTGTYNVVRTVPEGDQVSYSLWPADRTVPAGWTATGFDGTWSEGISRIEQLWTEQRPASMVDALSDQSAVAALEN